MNEYKKIIRIRGFFEFMMKHTYFLVRLAKINEYFAKKYNEWVDKYYDLINKWEEEKHKGK
ncbi:MAG: hypothetical protein ACTSPK_00230 [Candidatus Heimdallarchaeota archaeon]